MTQDTTRHDPWLERLSEYLDGDLSRRECRALEAHLRGCPACAAVADDLRRVVADAPALATDSVPTVDLWPGIERRLTPREPVGRLSWLAVSFGGAGRWLAAAAAAVVLVAVAGVVWFTPFGAGYRAHHQAANAGPERLAAPDADQEFDRRVAALEREARARLTLDPAVVDVLEENLATLDVAIANYRDELSKEPGDAQLRKRLSAVRQRKLDMLQHVVALASEGTD